ncbi:hypothetical protein M514_02639 [Trichuris suis]|uniref:Uncharacterized protein n=1 Tax=Trichuris suis TaxID=68888 RepID=A0A085MH39_9BILA|nr:hypothetical protein M513_02639 [Trichuris suis]KFD71066.1 hypothetical protein M514_02639 [Trichuris suis]
MAREQLGHRITTSRDHMPTGATGVGRLTWAVVKVGQWRTLSAKRSDKFAVRQQKPKGRVRRTAVAKRHGTASHVDHLHYASALTLLGSSTIYF